MTDPLEPETLKGAVKHQLRFIGKKTVSFRLLKTCVLRGIEGAVDGSDIIQTLFLQRQLRYQYYRLMKQDPASRQSLTYRLNCRPVGFAVQPSTRVCHRPRVCPWCYVRRWLVPMYRALTAIPKEVRDGCEVIGWRRVTPWDAGVPFLRANYGPHQWCRALATAQLALPWSTGGNGRLFYYHIGVQVVPANLDYRTALTRRAVQPPLAVVGVPKATAGDIVRIMSSVTTLPWLELFHHSQIEAFQKLAEVAEGERMLRITAYKP